MSDHQAIIKSKQRTAQTCINFCLGTVLNLGLEAVIVGVRNAVVDVPTPVDVSGVTTETYNIAQSKI
jgi:hypothetical protein